MTREVRFISVDPVGKTDAPKADGLIARSMLFGAPCISATTSAIERPEMSVVVRLVYDNSPQNSL
jgi:hypothetical protein